MTATLQIVDGIGGTVILDLNAWSGGAGVLSGRAGPLTLAKGTLSDVLGDPVWSPLAGPAGLGRRVISLPIVLAGSSVDDLAAKAATLMAATREPWWLKVQRHGATNPSYLRCFPCVPDIATQVTAETFANIKLGQIDCETDPFAYGARVDVASAAVAQDPAGTAWAYTINSVGGDSPTPLLLRLNDTTAFGAALGAYISVRRHGTPSNLTAGALTRQAETGNTLTGGTNVSLATISGDSPLSNSAGVRATFAAGYVAGNACSITFAAPTLAADVPGVYRMFIRVRRNGTAATSGALVMRAYVDGGLITPDEVAVPAGGTDPRLVDLGLVQWPSGQPLSLSAPVATSGAVPGAVTVELWRTNGGAATVDFDYLCWVPADEDGGYLTTDAALGTPSTQWVAVDGYSHQALMTSADPTGAHNLLSATPGGTIPNATWVGGVPRVSPGSNQLFIVTGLSPVTAWPKAQTLTVRASYWPRYTWLA